MFGAPVQLGVAIFPTDEAISVPELARLAEERGFDSLWLPEHTHIPVSRLTPYPGGGDLPREYLRTLDPFVALAAAASVTSRLLLATGICLLIQRDPIITAKEVASLDHLSGGRVIFGVGAGWNAEEMADHGTDPARRFGVLRERVGALRTLWSEEQPAFAGEHVHFGPTWFWPKPVQEGGPPVVLGGNGRGVVDRVLAYADGWLPNAVGDPELLAARIGRFHDRAEQAGRPGLPVTLYGPPPERERLAAFADVGVKRSVLWIPPMAPEKVQPLLDGWADKLIGRC